MLFMDVLTNMNIGSSANVADKSVIICRQLQTTLIDNNLYRTGGEELLRHFIS